MHAQELRALAKAIPASTRRVLDDVRVRLREASNLGSS